MTDWYWTDKGTQQGFQARPVVGGVFVKFLADATLWKKWSDRGQTVAGNWAPMPVPPTIEVIEPGSTKDPVVWIYTTQRPADGWHKRDFDASDWKQGPGGFGTHGTPGAVVRTEWDTPQIWIRRELICPVGANLASVQLYVHHDEDAEIYLNGVLAAKLTGFRTEYDVVDLLPAARTALKPGTNTLAVHCRQTTGGQYIDVGLARWKR
jgi:hypothetical protein